MPVGAHFFIIRVGVYALERYSRRPYSFTNNAKKRVPSKPAWIEAAVFQFLQPSKRSRYAFRSPFNRIPNTSDLIRHIKSRGLNYRTKRCQFCEVLISVRTAQAAEGFLDWSGH